MKNNYKYQKDIVAKAYIASTEDEIMYIIKTSNDYYIAVFDDAYEISRGKTFIGTKEEFKQKFDIEL
jgi:hypothetical protein